MIPLLNASGCLDALVAPGVARTLDAFVTKTVTPLPREGNPPPRIAETESGMLNSIGLQNPGIDRFLAVNFPRLAELGVPIWVSVGGFSAADYAETCMRLDHQVAVATIELNLSCPNVEEAPETAAELVAAARAVTTKPRLLRKGCRRRCCTCAPGPAFRARGASNASACITSPSCCPIARRLAAV